jgi:serine/threonine protein kinase
VAHLHARGVMHGDLYAHNTLWQPDSGHALLSDFGAATLLPTQQPTLSRALQALEVLAFGHLLNELLALAEQGQSVPAQAEALAQACTAATPTQRPDMAAVAQALAGLR